MLADANTKGDVVLTRPRLTSVERRAAIVAAAMDLFSKSGFNGTTTSKLAEAVGVSEPVLYQHFKTKRHLYEAMVESILTEFALENTELLIQLSQGSDDEAFFSELGRQILHFYLDQIPYVRLLMFSALEGKELANIWQEKTTAAFLGLVRGYIQKRVSEGGLKVEDAGLAARAYIGMTAHYGLMVGLFCPAEQQVHSRDSVLRQYVSIFLHGVASKK